LLSKLTGFISDQQEFPLLLAELDAGTLFYIVVGLLAAISHWITKRKEAAKQAEFLESAEDHDFEVDGESQESSDSSWLDKLENMVEEAQAHVEKNTKTDLPPIIAAPIEAGEQILHSKPEQPPVFQPPQMEEQPQAAKVAPVRLQQSPVYNSPIYSDNIGQQIVNDLNAARQGVVASIILNPPKALEDPEQATRY
jgi:hypothetical protein